MADNLKPGARFGPLAFSGDWIEIGKEIGHGATARVHLCTRMQGGEKLAVKVIDLQRYQLVSSPEEQLKRFETEVQTLRQLQNRRCLGLYDILRTERWIFLVMEHLSGGELFDKIIEKRRFSELEARYVFIQLLEGLEYIHAQHIMHRDLKPENILIASSTSAAAPDTGTLYDVKIADFGLSKMLGTGSLAKTMVGTPQYWAPEVIRGGTYDERADYWSLGATLFVMLMGKYPFKGEDPSAQVLAGTYDIKGSTWSGLSEAAKDLVGNLLQVQPAQRLTLKGCQQHPWVLGKDTMAPPQETAVALVQADGRGQRNPIGDSERAFAFSPRELTQLQLSFTASLQMACLACRHGHPGLSANIRQTQHKASTLARQTLKVMRRYADVAHDVKERILPEIKFAVDEAIPDYGLENLDVVNSWLKGMHKDGEDTMEMCSKLGEQLQGLIEQARQENLVEADDIPVVKSLPCGKLREGTLSRKTQELMEDLASLAKEHKMATPASSSTESERWKKELVDLLFFVPGVPRNAIQDQPATPTQHSGEAKQVDVAIGTGSTQTVEGEDGDVTMAEEKGVIRLEGAMELAANTQPGPHPLFSALRELRRVKEILEAGMAFWLDMDSTVLQLVRFKDQTRALILHSSKDPRLRQRFDQRLAEYSQFWGAMMSACRQYCTEVEQAQFKMAHFVNEMENAADAMDLAAHVDVPMRQ
mmetsp:Transcript_74452/g.206774  ORF Transcript_74452/g.206774 Transcript_74452/m.206774 type:complete len:703 (-) Transcript_74452:149-2257(-)